jgi:hypothetical protein
MELSVGTGFLAGVTVQAHPALRCFTNGGDKQITFREPQAVIASPSSANATFAPRSYRSGKKIQSVGVSASRCDALGAHAGGGVAHERNGLLRGRHVHGAWALENESIHATGGNTRGIADELRASRQQRNG